MHTHAQHATAPARRPDGPSLPQPSGGCTSRLHHLAGRLPVPARIARATPPCPAATTLGMPQARRAPKAIAHRLPPSCHWHASSTGGLSPNCASTCSGGADRPASTLVEASSASPRVPPPASPAGSGWCSSPFRRGRQTPHMSAAARFGPCPCCPSPAGPPGCRSPAPRRAPSDNRQVQGIDEHEGGPDSATAPPGVRSQIRNRSLTSDQPMGPGRGPSVPPRGSAHPTRCLWPFCGPRTHGSGRGGGARWGDEIGSNAAPLVVRKQELSSDSRGWRPWGGVTALPPRQGARPP
jgi:hypothetical protein